MKIRNQKLGYKNYKLYIESRKGLYEVEYVFHDIKDGGFFKIAGPTHCLGLLRDLLQNFKDLFHSDTFEGNKDQLDILIAELEIFLIKYDSR